MPSHSNAVILRKAGVATRIAAIILGPSAKEEAVEEFAIDLMSVNEDRLRAILVALPDGKLEHYTKPKYKTAWERLIKPKVRL